MICPVCQADFKGGVHRGTLPCPHSCEAHPQAPGQLHVVMQEVGRIELLRMKKQGVKEHGK